MEACGAFIKTARAVSRTPKILVLGNNTGQVAAQVFPWDLSATEELQAVDAVGRHIDGI